MQHVQNIFTHKRLLSKFQPNRTRSFVLIADVSAETANTENHPTKTDDLVLASRRLKIREIAETVGISKDRVGHILHEILGMRKLSARWVPRLLTPDNKCNPMKFDDLLNEAIKSAFRTECL
ncbi:uncharacterized protein LOC121530531 [Drosophila eugracilis]|uniref:uncharacterized protein LOC121530531 n=1 Tax=Drosophila eugracilis TaxID=29029 RepID=UPI001BDA4060|nr:uncharacterized protein LOC121530531 [Drosophila eugracilis]